MNTQEIKERTKELRMDLESKIRSYMNDTGTIPDIEFEINSIYSTEVGTGRKEYINDVEVRIKSYIIS